MKSSFENLPFYGSSLLRVQLEYDILAADFILQLGAIVLCANQVAR